ncbi:lysophospholipid acyltransferase family protein [Flammeovirga aprica]|uniref:Lysophospholipid acyltransferase family protein n=1 Tax=Flammeovirga aprica JL-4 TaxID=694437 RepID=A0A7X9RSL6_9BACT|nr:lysophospholipid acyltransferase family protein [Flammeovirga aprica]NME67380.1 lysophospholipid acyltransferase family protein [Flammeovirga aprica JL-4]
MIFIKLFSRLPFFFIHSLSYSIAFFMGSIIRYRRSKIAENIKIAFPEKSPLERKKLLFQFYLNLTDVGFEALKSYSMTREQMQKRFKVLNPEKMEEHIQKNEPFLLLAGHVTNWEWQLSGYASQLNFNFGGVYKPLSSKFTDKLMLDIRANFGGYPIPMAKTMREILVRMKRKEMFSFGLVADQSPPNYDKKREWVQFFNRETAFFSGPEIITQMAKMPVYYAHITRTKRGHYEGRIIPIFQEGDEYVKGSSQITKKYAELLEANIRESPADWLWSHNRWKYTREEIEVEVK